MSNSCHSCGMPLMGEQANGNYCQYCSDEKGNLLPREQVRQGIAEWLSGWAPGNSSADFSKRADHYMKAMPAWAE
ncbi:MAG: hypothetical protein GY754_26625 [bacterium]|nr:hypothetical protein [bacterium]